MKLLYLILSFFLFPLVILGQNGKLLETMPFEIGNYPELNSRITEMKGGISSYKAEYSYLDEVVMEEIFYESDGLKVKAFRVFPKNLEQEYPAIVYNRGGNREFGQLNEFKMVFILARVASWGYVVVASQYRGNDGGEGIEEFGGSDVNDVINLIPLLESMSMVIPDKLGVYGWSRGGMMTYLSLMKTDRFKAAAVGGALSDLKMMDESRGGEMGQYVFSELIPGYEDHKDSLIRVRSAVFNADEMSKTTPVLLLHGTADWRVVPQESLNMSLALQEVGVPYRLVMFEGGDHGLNEFDEEVERMVKEWFDKYLKNDTPLPDLKPHGK